MKRSFVIFFLLMITFNVFSESSDILNYYDSDLFKISYQFSGGLTISYQGQSTSTSFGISSFYKNALSEYPDVKLMIDSYSKKNLTGNILMFGGLGLTLIGVYYPLFSLDENTTLSDYYDNYKLALGMAIGGLVSEIIGLFLQPSSYQDLTQGVNLYNRHKIEDYN